MNIENELSPVVIVIQAIYYLLTGLWPMVHLKSFVHVTGPKKDTWLVKIFGALITNIGIVLLVSFYRKHVTTEILLLSITIAITLILSECFYVLKGRIAPIYLADAFVEFIFIMWVGVVII